MHANDDGTLHVRLPELGRLELSLGPVEAGYVVANGTLRPLPVGSTLVESGFVWAPPPGYLGPYALAFVRGDERIDVTVTVVEKPRVSDTNPQVLMQLDSAVVEPFGVGGSLAGRHVRFEGLRRGATAARFRSPRTAATACAARSRCGCAC